MSIGPLANLAGGLSLGALNAPTTLHQLPTIAPIPASSCQCGTPCCLTCSCSPVTAVESGPNPLCVCCIGGPTVSPSASPVGFNVKHLPPGDILKQFPVQTLNLSPLPLSIPPHAQAPPPVPGSGAPFSQPVNVVIGNIVGNPQVAGMLVNCIDTGVTLATTCGNVTFFHNTGGVKSYTMFAMSGTLCPGSTVETAHNAVTAHGTVPNIVSISGNFS